MINLYLFRKYWSKHKGRLFSLILSIILLSATLVFLILNERAELRRQLHEGYDVRGTYYLAAMDVTEEQMQQISELPVIDKIGKVSSIGKINVAGSEYTIGYYEDTTADELNHLPVVEGNMPTEKGEIAVPGFILDQIKPDAQIGDTITVKYADNAELVEKQFKLCGIISNNVNRFAMEFKGTDNGATITSNEIEYPIPSVYIHCDDLTDNKIYTDILISASDDILFGSQSENWDEVVENLWEINSNIVTGGKGMVLDSMSDMPYTEEGYRQTEETDDMRIIRIISYMIMLVAVISMLTGIISILPDRVESLRLLRSIGMSKRRLLFMFITEFILFWLIGTGLGIGLACGLHEILLMFQRSLEMSVYRGYTAEFIVAEKTMKPFVMPVILSFIIALTALIVPAKKILTMTFYKKSGKNKSKHTVKSFSSAYSRMTGSRFLAVISCISIVIVMCAAAFGYCYYTQSDKGTSYLTVGKNDTEESYYKVNGIDLKNTGYNCTITANIPKGNEIAVYDKEYGINQKIINELSETSDVAAWGAYPPLCVIYGENDKLPDDLETHIVPFNDKWEFYEQFNTNKIMDLHLILMNECLLNEIGGFDKDDVIIVGESQNFPYETGDTVPMFTCICSDTGHVKLDELKHIDVEITGKLNVSDVDIENNELLKNSGIFKTSNSYFIAMTAGKAEELGFYYPGYSSVFINSYGAMSDKEIKEYAASIIETPARIVTLDELEHSAKLRKISANANSIILFGIMLVLCLISAYNLLQMNVSNNKKKYSVLHSIGISIKKLRMIFIKNMMKYSLVAVIIGTVICFSGQLFLQRKYDKYADMLTTQQEIAGNDSFPEVIFGFEVSEFSETDELYSITKNIEELKSTYMLDKEMWLPDLKIMMCVIIAVFLLAAFVMSFYVSRKIRDERDLNND